jgi:hypothetical protein
VSVITQVVSVVGIPILKDHLNQLTVDLRVKIDTIQLKYSQTKD